MLASLLLTSLTTSTLNPHRPLLGPAPTAPLTQSRCGSLLAPLLATFVAMNLDTTNANQLLDGSNFQVELSNENLLTHMDLARILCKHSRCSDFRILRAEIECRNVQGTMCLAILSLLDATDSLRKSRRSTTPSCPIASIVLARPQRRAPRVGQRARQPGMRASSGEGASRDKAWRWSGWVASIRSCVFLSNQPSMRYKL